MTGPGTNVALYMEYALRNLLGGMDATTFSIVVVLIGIIFTNFCNSVVLGLVLTPVLLAVANAFDISSAPRPAMPVMECSLLHRGNWLLKMPAFKRMLARWIRFAPVIPAKISPGPTCATCSKATRFWPASSTASTICTTTITLWPKCARPSGKTAF